jgi:hypothetical protein
MGEVRDDGRSIHEDTPASAVPILARESTAPRTSTSTEVTAAPAAVLVEDAHSCPICLLAFEEGEDMRILPCDGRHRFHMDCIDPWLLNVSSLWVARSLPSIFY